MTLSKGDVELYHDIRSNITGGLSNVMHRMNDKGESTIHKLEYKQTDTSDPNSYEVFDNDTKQVITHCVGVDFNSLYPSSMSSVLNCNIPYTGHRMLMPGRLLEVINATDQESHDRALQVINSKKQLFIAMIN
jgi:archaellum component FlaG (FlaF/FlaG flagellin family)